MSSYCRLLGELIINFRWQVLKAINEIDSKEEITIDYQIDNDSLLVANYGFSLAHKERNAS